MRKHESAPKTPVAILTIALAYALLAGCPPGPEPTAPETAAPDAEAAFDGVLAAHQKLREAFLQGKANEMVNLLDSSRGFLVFHPMAENRIDGIEEAREGLAAMFAVDGTRSWNEYHPLVIVEGNVAWVTSHSVLETPSQDESLALRGTEIWRLRDGKWKLAHAHWSRQP